jgi:WD40 repeat protein/mono/diheme cytochrome c family protein
MHFRERTVAAVTMTILLASTAHAQDRKAAEAVSFDREAKPIFRKRCANCHNTERPRGELDLTTYAGVVAGGASGKAAVAGNPEESPIYTLAAHIEDPKMPPNAPKIPQREIDVIRRWIEGGLIEKAGDSPSPAGPGRSEALAATLVSAEISPHSSAVSALAVSPVAPIAAVSGHRQVLIFDLIEKKLLGALPFPEGDVFALKFSKDGQTLLAGGGVGAESGKVILFHTKDWSRASEVGDELDAVLAADLAPDAGRVVLGGPSRAVKVIANPGGQILHTFRKPTDWVTAAAFSPDGLLVAAGDRFGRLFLWETRSGQEFLTLRGHPKAITSIAWNDQGDRLFTAGEDGVIQLYDLHAAKVISRWEAHAGGVLSIAVQPSGRIASCGRDRSVKVWESDGKLVSNLGPANDQSTRVAWASDGRSVVSGDLSGEVRIWSLADSSSARLPMPVASRPAAVALVVPVLTPARPFGLKPVALIAKVDKSEPTLRPGDDLQAALASAREAASAAERTVAGLTRLAQARSRGPEPVSASNAASSPSGDALTSANAALIALRAALAAEPGNATLARAFEETERAVRLLEQKRDRLNPASASTSEDR